MSRHCCLICCRPQGPEHAHFLQHLGEELQHMEDYEWFLHKVASGVSDQEIVRRAKQLAGVNV